MVGDVSVLALETLSHHWTVALVLVFALAVRWYRSLHERVRLAHCPKTTHPVIRRWKSSSQVLQEGYRPPAWWSVGTQFLVGSLHTIWHNVVRHARPVPAITYERELLVLECGATVGLDWVRAAGDTEAPSRHDTARPIVFMHHGLAGCSRSHYIQSLAAELTRGGEHRVVVMVARGCGGVPLTTPFGFTATGFDDIRQAAEHIRGENPDAKMFAVGYSLGAGLLANYLGRAGPRSVFSGAVVASPCWDFLKTTPYFSVWSRHFLAASLQAYTLQDNNKEMVARHDKADYGRALAAKCVREFDAHAVVPVFGYKSVDDYYDRSSPAKHAHRITTPTLALSADDDPVCSVEGAAELERIGVFGPGLLIARTARGGHVSWAEGAFGHASWMDRAILEWLQLCRDFAEEQRPHADRRDAAEPQEDADARAAAGELARRAKARRRPSLVIPAPVC